MALLWATWALCAALALGFLTQPVNGQGGNMHGFGGYHHQNFVTSFLHR